MTNNGRTANLGKLKLISIADSSYLQAGDREETFTVNRSLAVQREIDHLSAGDAFFSSYPIFFRGWPAIIAEAEQEPLLGSYCSRNACSDIRVDELDITAVGAASLVLIGNGCRHYAESRIKHIRQYSASSVVLE